ncbi:MAG: hypothetical protein HYV63_05910 [Candidatus Schekmanbacteria bacterium]|nr:hypothetical protein [Candidatus Schekmanbacteria bacterium]
MTVLCTGCGHSHQVDLACIPATGARMRCRACGQTLYVEPPPWIEPLDELPAVPPSAPAAAPSPPAPLDQGLGCFIHTRRPAVAMCTGCGSPVCEACRNKLAGRNFCDACAREAFRGIPAAGLQPPLSLQRGALQPESATPPSVAGSPSGAARKTPIKDPFLAGLLSFLMPGLGQVYNGQIGKGIGMFFFSALTWVFLLGWVVMIWSITDAFRAAKHLNSAAALPSIDDGELTAQRRLPPRGTFHPPSRHSDYLP